LVTARTITRARTRTKAKTMARAAIRTTKTQINTYEENKERGNSEKTNKLEQHGNAENKK